MKKASFDSILCAAVLTAAVLFPCCSSPQNLGSDRPILENNPKGSTSASTTNKQVNVATENFSREWKSKFNATATELERNSRLWQKNRISNYNFVIAKYAGGTTNSWNRSPVLITVREGRVASIEKVSDEDSSMYSKVDGFEDFDTIDKLFTFARQRLENGNMIHARYEKKLGYPKRMEFKFSYDSHGSHSIHISKFEITK